MEWIEGVVQSNQLVGAKFRRLCLGVPWELEFVAGQYVLIDIGGERQSSYSICSLPAQRGQLEVLVDVSPAEKPPPLGASSRYVDSLRPGDKVRLSRPMGKFVLRDDGAQTLVFVATGSGISSIFPLFVEALRRGKGGLFFWGLRFEENIFWQERFEELKGKFPEFSYEVVLSEPTPGWSGKTGHVTEHVREYIRNKKEEIKNGEVSFYLCGNGGMIKDVSSALMEGGVPKERIYWEKYYEDSKAV